MLFRSTHVLDRSLPQDALVAEVLKIAAGPVSLVYDAISLPDTQAVGYALLARNGQLLTYNVEFSKVLLAQLPA